MSERKLSRVGSYVLDARIGDGPTGTVYYTENSHGAPLALKLMHPELSRREPAGRLIAELEKLRCLDSRIFLPLSEAGFDETGRLYLVTEALDGRDLATLLADEGSLPVGRALSLLRQVCDGLAAAHAAGLVHGGLKPRNVFVGDGDRVWLLDFGAARLAGGNSPGLVIGDPLYMAPEQLSGTAGRPADVYALGLIACQCLGGALPFDERAQAEVTVLKLGGRPLPLTGLDEELETIVRRALAPEPDQRPEVDALRAALERWAQRKALLRPGRPARPVRAASASPPAVPGSLEGSDRAQAAGAGDPIAASLEQFLREAHASFPSTDGWVLATDELELDDEDLSDEIELPGEGEAQRETALLALEPLLRPRPAHPDRMPWKWVGTALLASFLIGAVLVFVMVEALLPSMAVVPPAPARVARLPVVTPLAAPARPAAVALPAIELAGTLAEHGGAKQVDAKPIAAKPVESSPADDWVDPFAPHP